MSMLSCLISVSSSKHQSLSSRPRPLFFVPPNGESYQMVEARMKRWYDGLTGDVVATAHGGTCRGLMTCLGVATPAVAPLVDIVQGVVYVFRDGELTRYA